MSPSIRTAIIAAALALAPAARAGLAESWYLSRGRANMQIANYGAAIEAWRKALELNPNSREASHELCRALLQNGETDRAVAELDRHLARFPDDWQLAFEQARLLQWSRYAYRSKDAVRYLRMGLGRRDDPARRHELARLLGRDRATLDEALAEYRTLLSGAPEDAALRDEWLKLLLWDRRHRDEAVRELERRLAASPGDERAARELARITAEDPRRAGEAAGRYAALLERHPDDPDLRLGRARALARAGRRDEARGEYARALALRPSPETRLEYAEVLAADPASADAARREYEAVLRERPRSRRARVGLARVLGARRETSKDAIAVYETVLAEAPNDAEAHRGLAHAFAWNGDADRALAHGELAERYGPARPDVAALERSLRVGREPAAGGGARVLAQPGGARLSRVGAFVSGAAEPTPFTSSAVEAGFAVARGEAGAEASGADVRVQGEWRPSPGTRLELRGALDGVRRGAAGLSGGVALQRATEDRRASLELRRASRLDSFRAYAGEGAGDARVGAASDNLVELRLAGGSATRVELTARAGSISAERISPVFAAGLGARVDRALTRARGFAIAAGVSADALHHARDLSATSDPLDAAPGVFSPPLFVSASPRLSVTREAGARGWLSLDAGPALQVVGGAGGGVRAGGDARLAFAQRVGQRLRVGGEARAERVADVYTRLEAALTASLLFP
ncbi:MULTISPECIES: tetratricopeptide repeat protein [Anaeromyxobacter]|uniref:tetratricopeptide repeat protein n=1 Tax=Anaeromyxobacter TaxID=161492 RepID=UPI001F56172F|nr:MULTISPECIES: tetratricopeptide repeat protein [unclassified Anaeromyxobacter]